MKTLRLTCLLALGVFNFLHAQILSFGGPDDDRILSAAYDSSGNIFYTGRFQGTVDFDPSDGQDAADTFTASGAFSGFVCSYTPAGTFRFAFPLIGSAVCAPEAIAVTSTDDLVLTGGFVGTVDFDPGPATESRTGSASQVSTFLASYSNAGAFQSVIILGSSGEPGVYATSLDLDAAGNRYLSGAIEGSHDMDPSGSSFVLAATSGNDEAFVASYTAGGALRFARLISDSLDIRDLTVDPAGNSFIVGELEGTTDFDDSDGQDADDSISTINSDDGFVASFSPTGAFRFAFPLGSNATQGATGVAVDGDGNYYVTGAAYSGTDFDPSPAEAIITDTGGCFLASYTNGGVFRYVVSTDALSTGGGESKGMTVAARGDDIYVGGIHRGLHNFAPADAQGRGLLDTASTAFNEKDIFLLKFRKSGSIEWARTFDTQQTSAQVLFPYAAEDIAISPAGKVSIVGFFEPNAPDLDPSIDVFAVTGAGKEDAFAVQLDSAGYLPGSTLPSFEVTNTADTGDGSLRRALEFARHTPMTDTITFNIPGAGPHVISPQTPFPATKYPVNFDGLSQPGSSAASWPPDLRIVIDGTSAGSGANGFDLVSQFITTPRFMRGLVIQNFDGYGLEVGDGYRAFTLTACFIGTSVDGMTAAPNAAGGIHDGSGYKSHFSPELRNDYGMTGGSTFGRNLISGNGGQGIRFTGCSLVSVRNNYIGTTASGTAPLPNSGHGIYINGGTVGGAPSARYFTIGGSDANEANLIAHNGGAGVRLDTAREVRLYRNSIHSNSGLGIEFLSSTPLVNDVADRGDGGPNNGTNYPVIETALLVGGQTRVDGCYDGLPGGRFLLQFFSSPTADPSGFGEGKTFLGSAWVEITDGPADFSVTLPAVPAGHVITATATADERSHNGEGSSQFSPTVAVVAPNVTHLAETGPGSLRQAIIDANNNAGPDTLLLAPGLAGQVFTPVTDLPPITGETTLQAPDGFVISGVNTRRALTVNAPGQTVTLVNLTIEDGSAADGGGILHTDGTLNLRRCIVRNCTATGDGGGLAVQAGVVNVEDCRFSGNHANGSGGGVARLDGILNVDRSLLNDNSADVSGGGGYCVEGVFGQPNITSKYTNSTFTGNTAPVGGGFRRDVAEGTAKFTFCTVVENEATTSGGGISGSVTAENCIVSMNTAPAVPDVDNVSTTYNFIGGDPKLGPLRDNGGLVPTFALLTGSPAIDAFPVNVSGSGMDARRAPRNSGDRPDRGAFEYYHGPFAEEAPSYSSWAINLPIEDRDELADPNDDGIPNLVSMYFGIYALGPNNGIGIDTRLNDAGDMIVSYSLPTWVSRTGVTSSALVAEDLPTATHPNPWSAAPASVELGSTTTHIDYELTIPTNRPRKFVTFEVTNGSP